MRNLILKTIKRFRNKILYNECNDCTEISFPFLDKNKDNINIFITLGDIIRITDDGYYITNMIKSGRANMNLVHELIDRFGLKLDVNEIVLECNEKEFARRIIEYIQALNIIGNI